MCCSIIFDKEKTQKILAEMPDRIKVFKAVRIVKEPVPAYSPVYFYYKLPKWFFRAGLNITTTGRDFDNEPMGFHFFTKKEDADNFYQWHINYGSKYIKLPSDGCVIKCIVHKHDIIFIGKDNESNNGLTIITKAAIFPAYPETEVKEINECPDNPHIANDATKTPATSRHGKNVSAS